MPTNGIPGIETNLVSSSVEYIWQPWNDTVWFSGSTTCNDRYLDDLAARNRIPVVDFSIEHWGNRWSIDQTHEMLTQRFPKFLIMSHDPDDHACHANLLYYPYWYHRTREQLGRWPTVDDSPKTYLASCLNQSNRPHRVVNYFYLSQKPYAHRCFLRFRRLDSEYAVAPRPDDPFIPTQIAAWWQAYQDLLPTVVRQSPWFTNHVADGTLPALCDAYVNIVTETSVLPRIFITEKTWKALCFGQFFVVIGNPGTVRHLRDLGVDTFDDIIDHDHYDNETDWLQRISRVHEVLDQLLTMDLAKLWKQTHERRVQNQQKIRSGHLGSKYTKMLHDLLV